MRCNKSQGKAFRQALDADYDLGRGCYLRTMNSLNAAPWPDAAWNKVSTTVLSWPLRSERSLEKSSTDFVVSSVRRIASSTILSASATVLAFADARPTLAVNWLVAAACSLSEEAMESAIAAISAMVLLVSAISSTERRVTSWMSSICLPISSVAFDVWVERTLTSEATTANPLPALPARAASICGVERQEVGLRRDFRDYARHRSDLADDLCQ